jgi:ankyrin repeat protein
MQAFLALLREYNAEGSESKSPRVAYNLYQIIQDFTPGELKEFLADNNISEGLVIALIQVLSCVESASIEGSRSIQHRIECLRIIIDDKYKTIIDDKKDILLNIRLLQLAIRSNSVDLMKFYVEEKKIDIFGSYTLGYAISNVNLYLPESKEIDLAYSILEYVTHKVKIDDLGKAKYGVLKRLTEIKYQKIYDRQESFIKGVWQIDILSQAKEFNKNPQTLYDAWKNKLMIQSFVEWHQNNGLNINTKDSQGKTLLDIILTDDTIDINITSEILHHPNFEINLLDNEEPPLIKAIRKQKVEVVKLLLERKDLQINLPGNAEMGPLYYAIIKNNIPILRMLLEHHDIDVNYRSALGFTSLQHAILLGNIIAIQMLIVCQDLDINAQDKFQWTALHIAVSRGNSAIVNIILACQELDIKAINDTNNGKELPFLYYAIEKKDVNVLRELLRYKNDKGETISVDKRTPDGKNLLQYAVEQGNVEILEELIESVKLHKIDVNIRDNEGHTALTKAVSTKQIDMVKRFLQLQDFSNSGIGFSLTEKKRALEYAKQGGDAQLIKLLTSSITKITEAVDTRAEIASLTPPPSTRRGSLEYTIR